MYAKTVFQNLKLIVPNLRNGVFTLLCMEFNIA